MRTDFSGWREEHFNWLRVYAKRGALAASPFWAAGVLYVLITLIF